MNSIRALGTYTSGDIVMQLTQLAKQPRYYKQVLALNGRELHAGFDGHELWFKQNHPIVDESDEPLMRLNRALAMLECSIPAIVWEYENALSNEEPEVLNYFELLPEVEWQGRTCIVVKNTRMLDGPVFHYIDKASKLELYRRASVQISERSLRDVELFFKDPLEDSFYPLPSGFELWVDGQLYCTADFDKVEVNRGLAGYLFRPTSLSE